MTQEQEAIDLVEKLNGEIYEKFPFSEHGETPFEFTTNGYSSSITFYGVSVWDTEFHRLFRDDDTEIPLEEYVRNEAMLVVNRIATLKP